MKGEEAPDSPKSQKQQEDLNLTPEEVELRANLDTDAEFQRFVKSAPAPVRQFLFQMTRMQGGMPISHPLFDKFTPEHLDKFLDYSHQDEVNAYSLASSNRWFHLGYALLFTAALVFLIIYLAPNHKDLLTEILKLLAVFAGGFGAGFGTKTFLEKGR